MERAEVVVEVKVGGPPGCQDPARFNPAGRVILGKACAISSAYFTIGS